MVVWPNKGIFQPEEVDFLDKVFEEACRRYGVIPKTEDGEALAQTIILNYEVGLRDYHLLLCALDGIRGAAYAHDKGAFRWFLTEPIFWRRKFSPTFLARVSEANSPSRS